MNIEALHAQAKANWKASQQKQKGTLALIEASIPYWVILLAVGLLVLSAPHTAEIFNRLSPWAGVFAPLVIEFGLLFTALRRKYDRAAKVSTSKTFQILEGLCFVSAMIVNAAGAFVWVASGAGLEKLPLGEMVSQWSTLPALSQVSLILVVFNALMIPIGTVVAGEAVAALIFERSHGNDELETAWKAVELEQIYRTIFQQLISEGLTPSRAQKKAASLARSTLQVVKQTSSASSSSSDFSSLNQTGQADSYVSIPEMVLLLRENPDWLNLSERQLARTANCTPYAARVSKQRYYRDNPAVNANGIEHHNIE